MQLPRDRQAFTYKRISNQLNMALWLTLLTLAVGGLLGFISAMTRGEAVNATISFAIGVPAFVIIVWYLRLPVRSAPVTREQGDDWSERFWARLGRPGGLVVATILFVTGAVVWALINGEDVKVGLWIGLFVAAFLWVAVGVRAAVEWLRRATDRRSE